MPDIHLDHIDLHKGLDDVVEHIVLEPVISGYVQLLHEIVLEGLVLPIEHLVPAQGVSQLEHHLGEVGNLHKARAVMIISRPHVSESLELILLYESEHLFARLLIPF